MKLAYVTRRAAISALALVLTVPHQPADAIVEGIPLYAPGEAIKLPDAGFETFLPRVEQIRGATLPRLKEAISQSDWMVAVDLCCGASLKSNLATLGSTASLLGDEAYTALSLKARYAAAAKRLGQVLASEGKSQSDAQLLVAEMGAAVDEIYALVPKVVVDQVRERERKLAGLLEAEIYGTAGSQKSVAPAAPAATTAAEPAATPAVGGLLTTPVSAGQKRCGIDIRC